jgi:acylphosphatase
VSIFKRKKYETFLEASGTSESSEITDSSGEYARGVWESRKLQKGQGSEMSRDLIRKHYWFSGRVQGVGFRYRACYIASSLGVTGWVRNNWDDRVEMEAQGTREELARMVEMLYRQSFIGIEGIEDKVIPVEVESGFYAR